MIDDDLSYARDGAQLFPAAAARVRGALLGALADLPPAKAGRRIAGIAALRPPLAADGAVGGVAATVLGPGCRPVRAILFDKGAQANWALGWHQDRTICVASRHEVAGFDCWTIKAGLHHVEPPADLLADMVTLRVHLDDVPADNAPLLIAPGSHRLGRLPEDRIDAAVQDCGSHACTARAGDVWLHATLILHASERTARPGRRRVLQVDYAARDLPGRLQWLGI